MTLQKFSKISFTVRSIECVACTPFFKRELDRTRGVKSVRALVMLNRIEVEFDESVISRNAIEEKIRATGSKAGFGGKILFSD